MIVIYIGCLVIALGLFNGDIGIVMEEKQNNGQQRSVVCFQLSSSSGLKIV